MLGNEIGSAPVAPWGSGGEMTGNASGPQQNGHGRRASWLHRGCGSVVLLWLVAAQAALAHHPESVCFDTHDFGSESMTAALFEYHTNQPIAEGTPLLVGTRIKVAGLATAYGSCTIYFTDGYGGCMLADLPENPQERDVYNINHSYTVTNS